MMDADWVAREREELRLESDADLATYALHLTRAIAMADEDGTAAWQVEWMRQCLAAASEEMAWRRRAANRGGGAIGLGDISGRVDTIKAEHGLVRVIEADAAISLRRSGSNWMLACPFHDDRHPSMVVYTDSQTFHCFGCAAHGDVFTWLMLRNGIDFMSALRLLEGKPTDYDLGEATIWGSKGR